MHPVTPPTLSICIPTFNRSDYLRLTLTQIAQGLVKAGERWLREVEVIVVDNCSTDGTAEMVTAMSKVLPRLHYQRNEANMGVERNIIASMCMGTGNWVWPLGDDDLLAETALLEVLTTLESATPDCGLLLLNYGQVNKDGVERISHRVCDVPTGWEGDLFGDNGLHRFRGSFDLLAFISAVIVRRDTLRLDTDYAKHNSFYGHVGVVVASCLNRRVKVIGPGVMTQRQHNIRTGPIGLASATVAFQSDTFAGMTLLLKTLCDAHPEAMNVYLMTCNEGPGDVEEMTQMPALHWFFNTFARPHLKSITADEEQVRLYDQLLEMLAPVVHPHSARKVVVDFRRDWQLCRQALGLHLALKEAL
jgi:hypothetical protein